MKILPLFFTLTLFLAWTAFAEPTLTLYTDNFGVVREILPLSLQEGVNEVRFSEVTAHLEPESVFLRDPMGETDLVILEQNYRSEPVSQELLLQQYEGRELQFLQTDGTLLTGKLIRPAYVAHASGLKRFGPDYYSSNDSTARGASGQPIVEIDGKIRFQIPGVPIFPPLEDHEILKPSLTWLLQSNRAADLQAELSYISGGFGWLADYNLIAPVSGEVVDLVGWVTLDNLSGRSFEEAQIKLVAGDVSKVDPQSRDARRGLDARQMGAMGGRPVEEKSFEDYHLYTLNRKTTLHDRETKQVEFIRASGVKTGKVYVYDGAIMDWARSQRSNDFIQDRNYGSQSNPKIWVMREFKNSNENSLGMPLPKGRVRFYRQDTDGQLEFTGENTIEHTPKDETLRVYTGNAFDLVGERRQTQFEIDNSRRTALESFEIQIRNHSSECREIRVVEHPSRGATWEVQKHSHTFLQTDSRTLEFRIQVEPEEEVTLTYTALYKW